MHERSAPPGTSPEAAVSIRPASEDDEPILRSLYDAFQAELGGPAFLHERWEDAWADLRKHVADGLAFVADDGGRISGFVFATVPKEHPDLCHVTDLYVVPDARRAGVARSLLRTIVDEIGRRGDPKRRPRRDDQERCSTVLVRATWIRAARVLHGRDT
jgi:GNAT superfamily N-acetyltransferase